MRTLLIDNYDSYTYNLFQLLCEVNGAAPEVVRNDEVDWEALSARFKRGDFDNVVVSPGPGTPERDADVGVCRRVFEELHHVPVLGICLGLQVLASVHGATVRHAPYPVHGRLSGVRHNGHSLFSGIPSGDEFAVVRYHSLAVDETTLPPCLEATAWAAGVLPSAALRGSAQHSSSPKAAGRPSHAGTTTGTAHGGGVSGQSANGTAGSAGPATINGRSLADGPLKEYSYGSPDGHVNGSGSAAEGPASTSAATGGRTSSTCAMVVDHGRDAAKDGSHGDARDRLHSAAAADPLTTGTPYRASAQAQHVRVQRSSRPDHAQAGGDPDVLMGLAHRERPHMAVQFHPESVDTAYGIAVLQNFRDCTLRHLGRPVPPPAVASLRGPPGKCMQPAPWESTSAAEAPADISIASAAHVATASLHLTAAVGGGAAEAAALGSHRPAGSSSEAATDTASADRTAAAGSSLTPQPASSAAVVADGICLAASDARTAGADGGVLCSGADSLGDGLRNGAGVSVGGDSTGSLEVLWRRQGGVLASCSGSAAIFQALHGGDGPEDTFWLDSAATDRARFSYCGGRGGALWQRVTYRLPPADAPPGVAGMLRAEDASGRVSEQRLSIWDFLERETAAKRCSITSEAAAALPFDFWGGYVGYLGYGLKAECGGEPSCPASDMPDAALFLADRVVVCDHKMDDVYVVALANSGCRSSADEWMRSTAARIQSLSSSVTDRAPEEERPPQRYFQPQPLATSAVPDQHGCSHQLGGESKVAPVAAPSNGTAPLSNGAPPAVVHMRARHSRKLYMQNVRECLQALHDGESYELCLTTTFTGAAVRSAWECYQILRRINPAPYGAWLSFGDGGPEVCCSSPERFLRGGRGRTLEAKPIKGTAKRSPDPAEDAALAAELQASEKNRAENLMIVDLLRNDLGRVCDPGSVHVPALIALESFATVHQLVSTVRGRRRADATAVQAIRAAFPGGSMTGAPKLRSMQILDRLEGGPRGVYSGCIGFIGLNDTFDLSIVIRTAVFNGGRVTIGAGGAIVIASTPEEEYEEMHLKAAPLLHAVGATILDS